MSYITQKSCILHPISLNFFRMELWFGSHHSNLSQPQVINSNNLINLLKSFGRCFKLLECHKFISWSLKRLQIVEGSSTTLVQCQICNCCNEEKQPKSVGNLFKNWKFCNSSFLNISNLHNASGSTFKPRSWSNK